MINVRKIVKKRSGRTVFWSMSMLPKAKREALYTLIAFTNHLEEIMSAPSDVEEKKEILNLWREELDNIYDKKVPKTDIGRRIYKNCMRFKLPKEEFISLIESVAKNINNPIQAPSLKQFQGYCRNVGGMTSSLSLRVFGCNDEKIIKELSGSLGSALQITNILRNVKEDAAAGRLYIPRELLEKAGITSTDPKHVVVDKNLAIAREELARIADSDYEKVYELLNKLDKSASRPIRLITDIYKRHFDIMEKRGWEIISPKSHVNKLSKLKILLRSLLAR